MKRNFEFETFIEQTHSRSQAFFKKAVQKDSREFLGKSAMVPSLSLDSGKKERHRRCLILIFWKCWVIVVSSGWLLLYGPLGDVKLIFCLAKNTKNLDAWCVFLPTFSKCARYFSPKNYNARTILRQFSDVNNEGRSQQASVLGQLVSGEPQHRSKES